MSSLQIQLLGSFHLIYNGTPVIAVNQARLQSLVAYLLLHRDAPQSRQHLAFLFWPDSSEDHARNSLRNLLHQIRRTLPSVGYFVTTSAKTAQWRADVPYSLDVAEFEELLRQAKKTNDEAVAIAALQQAVTLYRGDLLPSCYDDWIDPIRLRLREQYADALEHLIHLLENQRDYRGALRYAQQLLRHDSLREETYQHLMHLYAVTGDRARALRAYDDCAALLHTELGVEPSPATQMVYEHLRHQEALAPLAAASTSTVAVESTLVGRKQEWATLVAAWQETVLGKSHLLLISGEAGIGKTRLSQEMLDWAARRGVPVASARSYETEGGVAYGALMEWLRSSALSQAWVALDNIWLSEVARVLPEVRLARPNLPLSAPMTESWHRQRLFEALARAFLASKQPLLLFLDDLQWADQDTLEFLLYLLRTALGRSGGRSMQAPLLIITTLRHEEVVDHRGLAAFLLELRRNGLATELKLGPLNRQATAVLAKSVTGVELASTAIDQLYQDTEGNPLFIVETVRAYASALPFEFGSTAPSSTSTLLSLPPKVQAVIEARLFQLTPLAMEQANLAAVIGREFSFELLSKAGNREEVEVMLGVEELLQRRIVREQAAALYDFSHDKLREVAYSGLSTVRRRLLHRRVGEALAAMHSDDIETISAQAAVHFEQANSLDQAMRHYLRAAVAAASLHAYYRAERLYARAIELARKLNLSGPTLIELYTERGRMLEHAGEYTDAVQLYQELESLAQRRGDKQMEAVAVARLATCFVEPSSTHNQERAKPLFERGLALARELGDHELEARLLWSKMAQATYYDDDQEAQAAGEASISLARQYGLRERLAYALNDLASNLRLSGRQEQGQRYADEARTLFRDLNNLPMLADNLSQQTWHEYHGLNFAGVARAAGECVELCQRIDNRWNLSLVAAVRGMMLYSCGAWGQAITTFAESMEFGKQAGLVIAQTVVPIRLGDLWREIGYSERAQALHLEAHALSLKQAPFFLQALEAQLAMDALAIGEVEISARWLHSAQTRMTRGAIRAWSVFADLASALVRHAEYTGEWKAALATVEQTLLEAQQRRLPIYFPTLLVKYGRCFAASGQWGAAETKYREAIVLAEGAGMRPVLWQAHVALMELYQKQQDHGAAHAEEQAAATLLHSLVASLSDPNDRNSFLATPAVQAVMPSER